MAAKVFQSGDYSDKKPNWYWIHGLHDAKIISMECSQLPYSQKTKNPVHNCMKLLINSSGALYDNMINSITFFNYKILTPDIGMSNVFWLQDILNFENGKYALNITVTDCKSNFVFSVRFEYAEVERLGIQRTSD